MEPIVNGLEPEYENVLFLSLNARDDGEGEAGFETLSLPGHPGVVIFDAEGRETYRGIGVIDEDVLREALEAVN